MLLGLRISVALSQAKVHNVDNVLVLGQPDEKVVWLDVSVNEVVCVDLFQTLQHLVCEHEYGLERESARAECEQLFKGRTQ